MLKNICVISRLLGKLRIIRIWKPFTTNANYAREDAELTGPAERPGTAAWAPCRS